jgi:hypothetical protein
MCAIWFSLGFPPDQARIDNVAHRSPDGAALRVRGEHGLPLTHPTSHAGVGACFRFRVA